MKFPWSRSKENGAAAFKPLDNNTGYLLNVEGNKIIALKLPSNIAEEIAGQSSSRGILAKLKAKFSVQTDEADQEWLIVTSTQNRLLENYESFQGSVAQALTNATGTTVTLSNLVISASTAVTRPQRQEAAPPFAHLEPQADTHLLGPN